MPKKTVADRIKAARKAAGLSQAEAAKAWGFKTQTLQQWEHGRHEPRGLYLEKLEDILKKAEV